MPESEFVRYYKSVITPSAAELAKSMQRAFAPGSMVEVGCVSPVYVDRFRAIGVDAFGVAAQLGLPNDSQEDDSSGRVVAHDLLRPNPFGHSFDVALSLEVADKLAPDDAGTFVKELCSYSDMVVFSAAAPGQGGSHINLQPLEYWIERFWDHGFSLDVAHTIGLRRDWVQARAPDWLCRNVAVFANRGGLVRGSDAAVRLALGVDGWFEEPVLRFLFMSARAVPVERAIVEIGAYKGRGTIALALGSLNGARAPVHAIDHHRGDPTTAARSGKDLTEISTFGAFFSALRSLRLEGVIQPFLGDSVAARAGWRGAPVGLLVIDASSDYRGLIEDVESWRRWLAPGALVVFGGFGVSPAVRRVVEEAVGRGHLIGAMRLGGVVAGVSPETRFAPTGKSRTRAARPSRRSDRISIIMATRNEGDKLRATVDDLLRKTRYADFELFVLDDGSDDGSTDFLINPAYHRDKRITLVRKKRQVGYLKLWIEGVRLSNGSIIKFLDSHHCFEPYWLTNLYEALRGRDFKAIVGPVVCGMDEATWSIVPGTALFGYTFRKDFTRIRCLARGETGPQGRVPWLCGHQMMMARNVYDEVGGLFPFFAGHGTDDSDLCLRAFLLGYDCHVEPTSIIGHCHKNKHMNQVTYGDIAGNVLMSVFLNLGPEQVGAYKDTHRRDQGFAEGLERMEAHRAELERFRDWIARRQHRNADELLERLAHY